MGQAQQPIQGGVGRAVALLGGAGEEGQPQLAQAGKFLDRQVLDAGVLEQLDQPALEGVEGLGAQLLAGVDQVRGAVGGAGPIDLAAGDAAVAIEGIRQVEEAVRDEGPQALAALVVAGGGPHEEGPRPQGPQVEVELALVVHQQAAAALLLQHGAGGFGGQAEVGHLAVQVPGMGLGAPQGPAAQPPQGEFGQELVHVLHHGSQAPGGLAGKLVDQAEEATDQLGVPQTLGRQGQVGEQQGDDGAGGVGGEFHHAGDDVDDDVLADLLDHPRQFLDVGQHQVLAPAHAAHGAHALQVVLQAPGRHDPRRLLIAGFQGGVMVVVARVQATDVLAEVDAHGACLPSNGFIATVRMAILGISGTADRVKKTGMGSVRSRW